MLDKEFLLNSENGQNGSSYSWSDISLERTFAWGKSESNLLEDCERKAILTIISPYLYCLQIGLEEFHRKRNEQFKMLRAILAFFT